jgi:hypothetical protein
MVAGNWNENMLCATIVRFAIRRQNDGLYRVLELKRHFLRSGDANDICDVLSVDRDIAFRAMIAFKPNPLSTLGLRGIPGAKGKGSVRKAQL